MLPTWIGLAIAALALLLAVRGSVSDMFSLTLCCTLMGGSAALTMPALGASTVPPAQFALLFLLARLLAPGSGRSHDVAVALRANWLLGVYAAYGLVMGMIGPRLFAGAIRVVPMRFEKLNGLLDSVPLQFTMQNVTASVYMTGTFLAGVAAHAAMQDERAPRRFVTLGVVIAWIHMFLGLSEAWIDSPAYTGMLSVFRNGSYAQLDQTLGSLARINGIFPEPSSYTAYAFIWFVFLFECWYRDVLPRRTGPAAAAMAVTLFFTTSSTAYVGLAGYGIVFVLRSVFLPWSVSQAKAIILLAAAFVLVLVVAAIVALLPRFAAEIGAMLAETTVGKQTSESGIQRAFWARVGLNAFVASGGLGVGPGSFRSSSFLTAMLGSVGLIGTMLFLGHFIKMWRPARASTYLRPADPRVAIGVAASWAAFGAMIPLSVIGVSSDPGTEFAIFAGVALALRARRTAPAATATDRQEAAAAAAPGTVAVATGPDPAHAALSSYGEVGWPTRNG